MSCRALQQLHVFSVGEGTDEVNPLLVERELLLRGGLEKRIASSKVGGLRRRGA
jgi:hypothetical protein